MKKLGVAPHVGAWIETTSLNMPSRSVESHPTWVRGLKLVTHPYDVLLGLSHPTWVRGLKPAMIARIIAIVVSHPTWVRGLKRPRWLIVLTLICRTPRGCVD